MPFAAGVLGHYRRRWPGDLGLVLVAIALMRAVIWLYPPTARTFSGGAWMPASRAGLALGRVSGLVSLLAFLVAPRHPRP